MALEDHITLIQKCPTFQGFPEDALRLLAFSAEPRRLSEGKTLFNKGDRSDAAYLVTEGQLLLETGLELEKLDKKIVEVGTLVDELALVITIDRPVTASAYSDCNVLRIGNNLFTRLIGEFPGTNQIFLARIRSNLVSTLGDTAKILEKIEMIG